jgi:hypothetical protein
MLRCLAISSLACCAAAFGLGETTTKTVTFESYPDTWFGFHSSFVDAPTGIRLVDIQPFGMSTDFANVSGFPSLYQNNTILVQNIYQPGGTIGLSQNFGFKAEFPDAGFAAGLDILYITQASGGSATLSGYNASGQLISSVNSPAVPAFSGWSQMHLDLTGPDIRSIIVTANGGLSTAYDNISVTIPEPASVAIVALLPMLSRRRR